MSSGIEPLRKHHGTKLAALNVIGVLLVLSYRAPRTSLLGRELPIRLTTPMCDRVALHQGTFGQLRTSRADSRATG